MALGGSVTQKSLTRWRINAPVHTEHFGLQYRLATVWLLITLGGY